MLTRFHSVASSRSIVSITDGLSDRSNASMSSGRISVIDSGATPSGAVYLSSVARQPGPFATGSAAMFWRIVGTDTRSPVIVVNSRSTVSYRNGIAHSALR